MDVSGKQNSTDPKRSLKEQTFVSASPKTQAYVYNLDLVAVSKGVIQT